MSSFNYTPAPFDASSDGSNKNSKLESFLSQEGSGKSKKKSGLKKKTSKKSSTKKSSTKKSSTKKSSTKKSSTKKVSGVKKFTRIQLVRLAKKHGVSCRRRDGTPRTKEQLYRSLRRKKLI